MGFAIVLALVVFLGLMAMGYFMFDGQYQIVFDIVGGILAIGSVLFALIQELKPKSSVVHVIDVQSGESYTRIREGRK